jgi:hypothetical protein
MMKLISENIGGNIHEAVELVNRLELAQAVLQIYTSGSGMNSIVVLRVHDTFDLNEHYAMIRKRGSR